MTYFSHLSKTPLADAPLRHLPIIAKNIARVRHGSIKARVGLGHRNISTLYPSRTNYND